MVKNRVGVLVWKYLLAEQLVIRIVLLSLLVYIFTFLVSVMCISALKWLEKNLQPCLPFPSSSINTDLYLPLSSHLPPLLTQAEPPTHTPTP